MMEVCRIGEWLALVRICPADPSPYIIRRCRRKVANMSTLAKARLICANERCNASDVVVAQLLVHPRLDHGLRWWFVSEPGTSSWLLLAPCVSRLASHSSQASASLFDPHAADPGAAFPMRALLALLALVSAPLRTSPHGPGPGPHVRTRTPASA